MHIANIIRVHLNQINEIKFNTITTVKTTLNYNRMTLTLEQIITSSEETHIKGIFMFGFASFGLISIAQ
jgi:hypothetical protein